MASYNMDAAIENVYKEIDKTDSSISKKKDYSESDFLFMAFMALLKAYFAKRDYKDRKEPKTYMMGA